MSTHDDAPDGATEPAKASQREHRAAMQAERAEMAKQAWEDIASADRSRDENMVRLKAARLERDAEIAAAAPAPKAKAKAKPKAR
ncbi:hypothetical protein OPKNFCMD_2611 [Methylobacterium crusticola]|uniref:Transcriptional regulator n=1 Tax=Methylobacterium crusticola TaxID=1697972 RepID=A0ABQ4QWW3_9HYPH|nr:hypothetical protein [Methylobacterium crusticola]GJD49875.1 hypothetical protein OPKNFCMD_2611 [Methylobacterium crusticola]